MNKPLSEPATGWVVDSHGIGHEVRMRGPSCSVSWCGVNLFGPIASEWSGRCCARCYRRGRMRPGRRGVRRRRGKGGCSEQWRVASCE